MIDSGLAREKAPDVLASQADYRTAMAQLAAAVTILTTDGPAGRHGLTATAVCSVTDQPPTLIACLNRSSGSYARYIENGSLGVNVLGVHQQAISARFARTGGVDVDRFALGPWGLNDGAPLLDNAAAVFQCRVVTHNVVGTHVVLIAQVQSARYDDRVEPLLYHARRYKTAAQINDIFGPDNFPAAEDIMF